MEEMYFEKPSLLKKSLSDIQEKLGVKIVLKGRKAFIEGPPLNEYETLRILEAIQFGFSPKKSLSLLHDNLIFRVMPIKSLTRRKNLYDVRARLIGKEGKTRRTIEQISGCDILIKDNAVGIIGSAENIDNATTAVTRLIKGSKQANVYNFLERMNSVKEPIDLGLKAEKRKSKEKNKR